MSDAFVGFCAGATLAGMFLGVIIIPSRETKWHQEAIENNAAYWTIDAKTGEKAFTWRVCEPVSIKEAQETKPTNNAEPE